MGRFKRRPQGGYIDRSQPKGRRVVSLAFVQQEMGRVSRGLKGTRVFRKEPREIGIPPEIVVVDEFEDAIDLGAEEVVGEGRSSDY